MRWTDMGRGMAGLGVIVGIVLCAAHGVRAATRPEVGPAASVTPSGQVLTPRAAPGASFEALDPELKRYPSFRANAAVTTVVSTDGRTLLVLTSGFNQIYDGDVLADPAVSNQYVFVYDIARGAPRKTQVLKVPATFMGIAFAPDGKHFYVAGGDQDDVHVFARRRGRWAEQGAPIPLGHRIITRDQFADHGGVGLHVEPEAAGLAVTADGRTLVVANYYNDSLSLVDLRTHAVRDVQLRPGKIDPKQSSVAGGEYPLWVAVRGNDTAYVSSQRDREVDVVRLGASPKLVARIPVQGNPNRMRLDRGGKRLYVACDNEARVAVIDTVTNTVVDGVRVTAPASMLGATKYFHGTAPNGLALSPDGARLYVSDGGLNAVSVVALNTPHPEVVGLIPTGDYPNSVSVGRDGDRLYVANGRSVPGPNPANCSRNLYDAKRDAHCRAQGAYILQHSHGGLLSLPVPRGEALQELTHQVARNDHFGFTESAGDRAMMAFLHAHIRHVIYVVRENRAYDQVLGDLGAGNGDPSLVEFGREITPNAHRLAHDFVDLDNFYDTGEVSGNGWAWSTAARESDAGVKNIPVNYALEGLSYDWEGQDRNVNVGLPTLADRKAVAPYYPDDPDLLPGTNAVGAPDGPDGQRQKGYLWDAALRAGLSVRNYGFFIDLESYDRAADKGNRDLVADPHARGERVSVSTNPTLASRTDPYFRGFDNRFPDVYREAEWTREFAGYVRRGDLPSLELVRLMHDHLGDFDQAIDGVDTPDTQVADNDYAVGKLIETVAHSPYAGSTLVVVVEDDAQDGPDHVDAHRSVAFFAGPYVKHRAVVGDRYTTVNLIRTIEDILGFGPMTLNDAYERPMASVFERTAVHWDFRAVEPRPLNATKLPQTREAMARPRWHEPHPAAWWARHTKGYDWRVEDDIPTVAFDHLLWRGLRPARQPYPAVPGQPTGTERAADDDD